MASSSCLSLVMTLLLFSSPPGLPSDGAMRGGSGWGSESHPAGFIMRAGERRVKKQGRSSPAGRRAILPSMRGRDQGQDRLGGPPIGLEPDALVARIGRAVDDLRVQD